MNPNLAVGIFLDIIASTLGIPRKAATYSTFSLPVDVTGVPSTLIPEGSVAATAAGDQFATTGDVTLDGLGQGSVDFIAVESGAVPCGVGQLTQIVSVVPGWETVNNSVAATVGAAQESDTVFRKRRNNAIATQSTATISAILAAIANVDGVSQIITVLENYTGATKIIKGVTMPPHSIYAAVSGGTDSDVADALYNSKPPGPPFLNQYNPVQVDIIGANGQTYEIKFDRPTDVEILVNVTVLAGTVTNPAQKVKDALVQYANNEIDGETGLGLGTSVSPFELAGAINIVYPEIKVLNVEARKLAGGVFSTTTIPINVWEEPILTEANISVTLT
jgi:uncharacterized phage protein gp47/JayE